MQFVTAEDPAGELESDGQVLHVEIDVAPKSVEYVNALQSRQAVLDDEPWMTEYLPAAHAMQSDSASLHSVSRYFPDGQLTQADAPAPSA